MQETWQSVPVVREDRVRGRVVGTTTSRGGTPVLVVHFDDGARVAVPPQMLSLQADGAYRLLLAADDLRPGEELVIPVAVEELDVRTQEVARAVVRIDKRVETREETVEPELAAEEVTVERVPVNTMVEGNAPQTREEDGVLIIPVFEEVLVVEKRLLLREEVHVHKRVAAVSHPQTVTLRREQVDVQRTPLDEQAPAHDKYTKTE